MDKEQIRDFLLRLHFVNRSPSVGGMSVTAWNHGMRFPDNRITYHKQFVELCKSVSLPTELPVPEYPEEIYAAFSAEQSRFPTPTGAFEILFEGHMVDVTNWCRENDRKYNHVGSTGRYFQTEQEMFEKWKAEVLSKV